MLPETSGVRAPAGGMVLRGVSIGWNPLCASAARWSNCWPRWGQWAPVTILVCGPASGPLHTHLESFSSEEVLPPFNVSHVFSCGIYRM